MMDGFKILEQRTDGRLFEKLEENE